MFLKDVRPKKACRSKNKLCTLGVWMLCTPLSAIRVAKAVWFFRRGKPSRSSVSAYLVLEPLRYLVCSPNFWLINPKGSSSRRMTTRTFLQVQGTRYKMQSFDLRELSFQDPPPHKKKYNDPSSAAWGGRRTSTDSLGNVVGEAVSTAHSLYLMLTYGNALCLTEVRGRSWRKDFNLLCKVRYLGWHVDGRDDLGTRLRN